MKCEWENLSHSLRGNVRRGAGGSGVVGTGAAVGVVTSGEAARLAADDGAGSVQELQVAGALAVEVEGAVLYRNASSINLCSTTNCIF